MTASERFPKLTVIGHPLILHKLTIMRQRQTGPVQFRQLLREVSLLIGYEVTRDLPTVPLAIETPLTAMQAPTLGCPLTIVSILRAGLGMAEGLRELMPSAREGHIGLFRDPATKLPREYYVRLPDVLGRVLLLDPMLATGGSAVHAVRVLCERGVAIADLRLVTLISAPEGIEAVVTAYPDLPIYTAALDERLDEHAYIVPGLGDAGDRQFGTQ